MAGGCVATWWMVLHGRGFGVHVGCSVRRGQGACWLERAGERAVEQWKPCNA